VANQNRIKKSVKLASVSKPKRLRSR
jgi:hypothetical protein